jgi:hypothetical protein
MKDESAALIAKNTWDLVPRPVGSNIVIGKWIFKHKFNSCLPGLIKPPGQASTQIYEPFMVLGLTKYSHISVYCRQVWSFSPSVLPYSILDQLPGYMHF